MSNLKKKFTVDEEIVWKFEDFDSQGEQNVRLLCCTHRRES